MAYIGNQPYQGTVTGDNIVDGTIKENDLANPLDLSSKTLTLPAGVALPSQTGHSGKYLTTDGASASWGVVVTGVRVSSITYPGNDTAVSPAGGQTITLTGSGFSATPTVFINGTVAPSVSFVSSTSITVVTPAMSAGTYHVYVVNPDGGTAIFVNGISYSGVPTWTTASGSLGTFDATFSIQLVATSDSAVTYALTTGSTLPAGITLSSGGLISGTTNTEQTFSFSVDAIDAQNQETPRSFSVTIVIADPYFDYNAILISANGTNGAQNNTFLDSSTNNFTITRNGNTTQGTFSPFSQTGWSNYFDGSGDFLQVADAAPMELGSGNWTIEMWVNTLNNTAYSALFGRDDGAVTAGSYVILLNGATANGIVSFWAADVNSFSTAVLTSGSVNCRDGTWHHIAVVRNSNTLTMYIDGTATSTASFSGSFGNTAQPLKIGSETGYARDYTGYISNVRLVVGSAVYTANFTPSTTPLTAISGTSLLTCQSNRFIDNSTNNFTITRNGDVSVQAFSPFNPTAAWSAATHGGSGYFDGNADYLTVPSSSAFGYGTGDFTIEMWIYPTVVQSASTPNIFDQRTAQPQIAPTIYLNNGQLIYYTNGANRITGATLVAGQWYHISVCRSSGSTRMFLNGVQTGSTYADTNNYITSPITIFTQGPSAAIYQAGYCGDVRVVKGTALYTTTFSPPTSPLTAVSGTSLLLNYTNAGIFDAASKNNIETVGNAQISTTQSKFGGSSMYFDGTGDFANTAPTINLEFGSGDFTIEGWIYPAVTTRMALYHGSSGTDWSIGIDYQSQKLCVWASSNGTTWNLINADPGGNGIGTITIAANTWTHVAFVRSGTTWQTYINGVRDLNLTGISGSIVNRATSAKSIAKWWFSDGIGSPGVWNGYIDDLRITKGYARYTSNFTPPTAAHKLR